MGKNTFRRKISWRGHDKRFRVRGRLLWDRKKDRERVKSGRRRKGVPHRSLSIKHLLIIRHIFEPNYHPQPRPPKTQTNLSMISTLLSHHICSVVCTFKLGPSHFLGLKNDSVWDNVVSEYIMGGLSRINISSMGLLLRVDLNMK